MPLIAILFLVLALFMLARVPRGYQAIWLGLILTTFGFCILGLIGFIARFGNYQLEGLIMPLDQPSWAWRILAHLPLETFMRFRLWSLVWFVLALLGFAFSYSVERWRRQETIVASALLVILALVLWTYDPKHLFFLYKQGAKYLNNPRAYQSWERMLLIMDEVTLALIALILIYALHRILRHWVYSTILQKRAQAFCVGMGCGVLSIFALLLFGMGKASVLNAHPVATTLLPAAKYPVFDITYLQAVPLAGLAFIILVLVSIFRYGFLGSWRVGAQDLDRQINVANQAVRLVLHTFKNRFLAIQMAMDLVAQELKPLQDKEVERVHTQVKWAREVCVDALTQLDELHSQSDRLQVMTRILSLCRLYEEAKSRCIAKLEGISIFLDNLVGEVNVWGDQQHLIAVFENLLENAAEALNEKANSDFRPWIRVEIGREYEWAFLRITDNGPGIPKENLRRIFRPFFTTKPTKNNWGMGLAYCHRVIKAHHGFLNLWSTPGEGTTAEVVLRCRENFNKSLTKKTKIFSMLRKFPGRHIRIFGR